ncbi:MAG: hypothetical protein M1546_26565 [Chloroflexi bacterium]|nr:hypothetical protein [Chloroflexota bacterium]
MTLQQPVVAAVIARTPNAQASLAAYGLALSIAVLLESPIQMLLATGAALAQNQASFRLLMRSTFVMGAALAGVGALLVFTPLGQVFFVQVLDAPSPIALQALLALKVMLPWPLVVAWRRLHQGVLIRQGATRSVGYSTVGRLATILVAAFLALSLTNWPGVVIGASALMIGALIEAVLVTGWLWLLRNKLAESNSDPQPLTTSRLVHFYRPLALTAVLTVLSWPLINAGIGRAVAPEQSLAAWPVVLSLLWLFTTPLQMLQQTTISLARNVPTLRGTRRLALSLGGIASGSLALLSFTPLLQLLLLGVLGVPLGLVVSIESAGQLLIPLPFLTATQAFYQGLLIRRQHTVAVCTAMGVNLLVLSSVLAIGIYQGTLPGFLLAPAAMTLGLFAEVGLLWWQASHPPAVSERAQIS